MNTRMKSNFLMASFLMLASTIGSFAASEGRYSGTTSEAYDFRLHVNGSNQIDSFSIGYSLYNYRGSVGSQTSTRYFMPGYEISISGNSFSWQSITNIGKDTTRFAGTFNGSSVSGTFFYTYMPNGGSGIYDRISTRNNITWSAASGTPTYTISYGGNNATGGTVPVSQTKTHDITLTPATNSGNLVRTGYTFAGWNTAANGSGTDYAAGGSYTTNAAVTLYAKWTPHTYTISYNTNDATGGTAPASQTKTHDVALTLATNSGNLIRTGYSFEGWNIAANGSGTEYAEGTIYTANAALTLYAKWTTPPFSITQHPQNQQAIEGLVVQQKFLQLRCSYQRPR